MSIIICIISSILFPVQKCVFAISMLVIMIKASLISSSFPKYAPAVAMLLVLMPKTFLKFPIKIYPDAYALLILLRFTFNLTDVHTFSSAWGLVKEFVKMMRVFAWVEYLHVVFEIELA